MILIAILRNATPDVSEHTIQNHLTTEWLLVLYTLLPFCMGNKSPSDGSFVFLIAPSATLNTLQNVYQIYSAIIEVFECLFFGA